MPGLLDRGIASHIRRQKLAAGREVVYQRTTNGVVASVELTAWPGTATFERTDNDTGATVIQADRCYLFATNDLFIGGANLLPLKGDRITETIDGQDVTFELMFDKQKPVWEFNDHTRQILRVWTKRVTPL